MLDEFVAIMRSLGRREPRRPAREEAPAACPPRAIGFVGYIDRPVVSQESIDACARDIAEGLERLAGPGTGIRLASTGAELVAVIREELADRVDEAVRGSVEDVARSAATRLASPTRGHGGREEPCGRW